MLKRKGTKWITIFTLICFLMNMVPLGYLAEAEASHLSYWNRGAQTGPVGLLQKLWNKIENLVHPPKNETDAAEPVNLFNGNFTYQHIDFSIPARGLPFTMVHEYSAQTTYNGLYGYGWSINYDMSLSISLDGVVLIRKGLENRRRYTPSETPGEYNSPSGVHDRLIKNDDNTFTLTEKHGTSYEFDTQGKLTAIKDRNGNQITIHYSEDILPLLGLLHKIMIKGVIALKHRISEVEDATGRKITFTYNETGRLAKITDFTGREFSYEYDDYGNLITITNPMNYSKQFSYDEDHNLTQEIDYNGIAVLKNTYDDEDRVFAQEYLGGNYTFEYDQENLKTVTVDPMGLTTIYEMNEAGNPTKIIKDPDGDNLIITRIYNDNMDMTSETDAEGNTTTYEYNEFGDLLSFTNALEQTTSYTYHPNYHLITSRTDPNNNQTTNVYDEKGNLFKTIDPLEKESSFTYDEYGRLLSKTDANGHSFEYQNYNASGFPEKIIDPLNQTSFFQYDLLGRLEKTTDAAGHITQYTYDHRGLLLTVKDAMDGVLECTYDEVGNQVTVKDQNGNITRFTYNDFSRLTKITDPLTHESSFTYNAAGNKTSVVDGNGRVTYFQYNKYGLLAQVVRKVGDTEDIIDEDDAVTAYTYDKVGNRLSIIDANDFVTRFAYDEVYQLAKTTNPENEVELFSYDEAGNLKTHTDASGYVLTYSYDKLNRLQNLSDAQGIIEAYVYDDVGNLKEVTDANGNTVTTVYDALDRPFEIFDPYGEKTVNAYDAVGNILSVTDREGKVTKFKYDALNRKIEGIDALNHTTQYAYDPVGNLRSIIDAKGNPTSYEYNALNLLIKETYADDKIRSFTYDAVGNLMQRQDQNDQETIFAYNDLYHLTGRTYTGKSEHNCTYTYDQTGRMLTANNADSLVTYTYDKVNRLLETRQNGKLVVHAYDVPNKKQIVTYPSGKQIRVTSDARSRISDIALFNGTGFESLAQFAYDGSYLQTKSLANGITTHYGYNQNAWLTDLSHKKGEDALLDFHYGHNKEGIWTHRKDAVKPENSEAYQYDDLYRLVNFKRGVIDENNAIQSPVVDASYDLDPVGNWNSQDVNGTVETRTHNEVNETAGVGSTTYLYDDNGNLIDDGEKLYHYDPENRLIRITRKSDETTIVQYKYDALGRRISKDVGATVTEFYYDGSKVIEQWVDGEIEVEFIYGLAINDPLVMIKGNQTYYYHNDGTSNILALTDPDGNAVERYSYTAYGVVTFFDGQWNAQTGSTIGNPYLFAGLRYDAESGFYHARARAYSPKLGRFIQRDALGYVDGMNLYEYARSNPINFMDVTGYICLGQAAKAALITLGVVAVGVAVVVAAPIVVGAAATALGASAATVAAITAGTAIAIKVTAVAALTYSAANSINNRINQAKMNNLNDPLHLKAAFWGIGDIIGYTPAYEGATGREVISGAALSEYEASNRFGRGIAQVAVTVAAAAYAGYKYYKSHHVPKSGLHGNKITNPNPSHRYVIVEKQTGSLHKTGISSGKLNKSGTSRRANVQVNKLNKQAGYDKFKAVGVEKNKTRIQVLKSEQNVVDVYFKRHGEIPPGMVRPTPN